jgi:hypothetical protein
LGRPMPLHCCFEPMQGRSYRWADPIPRPLRPLSGAPHKAL